MEVDPPAGAFPVMVHPAVFPVFRESEATRPELFWVIVDDAAWAPLMPVPATDARISTNATADRVIADFLELTLFKIRDRLSKGSNAYYTRR